MAATRTRSRSSASSGTSSISSGSWSSRSSTCSREVGAFAMAEGKKKGAGDRPGQKAEKKAEAAEKPAAEKKAEAEKKVEAKEWAHAAEEAHHPMHPHGAGHRVNLREVFAIFGVLFALTVLEVAVAQIPGISHVLKGLVLVSLAITKAACVGLYYMHLKSE